MHVEEAAVCTTPASAARVDGLALKEVGDSFLPSERYPPKDEKSLRFAYLHIGALQFTLALFHPWPLRFVFICDCNSVLDSRRHNIMSLPTSGDFQTSVLPASIVQTFSHNSAETERIAQKTSRCWSSKTVETNFICLQCCSLLTWYHRQ